MTEVHPSLSHSLETPQTDSIFLSGEGMSAQLAQRELSLRMLLDPPLLDGEEPSYIHCPNFEYAKDSGLIDSFYYNPETGEDAIVHILAGDVRTTLSGYREAGGFHHEPSAGQDTYVNHAAMALRSRSAQRNYRRFAFEPYGAEVVVKGFVKEVVRKNEEGIPRVIPASSSMFPSEYDPLTVLQSIRIARDNRDRSLDTTGVTNDNYSILIARGMAPLLDGEHQMPIKLLLEASTEKIITAMPEPKRTGYMNLTHEDIRTHLGLQDNE